MSAARILIVDDQPLNRELLHAYLADSGHTLLDADSGERALALALEQPPDLVLLDVMMPGLDGFETTRRLKLQAGETFLPVILLTSLSDSESRLLGLQTGADEFLTKPVNRQELSLRMGHLLALRANEAALKARNVALAELTRFKDEMSALIIHDLKNPLSVMLASYDYIAEGLTSSDPSFLEALEDSKAAGHRILRLLANLHDLALLEDNKLALRRVATNLSTLLGEIARERTMLAQTLRVAITTDAEDMSISADTDVLTRVLENLVDNAMRHAPTGGRISLAAHAVGDRAQIRIGNTGPPIPADARTIIFEKFGQAMPGAGRMNLGLGLYFCRLAMEAHGGKIWVEETESLPTVFVLQLPRNAG